jgi:hypothetical protein
LQQLHDRAAAVGTVVDDLSNGVSIERAIGCRTAADRGDRE